MAEVSTSKQAAPAPAEDKDKLQAPAVEAGAAKEGEEPAPELQPWTLSVEVPNCKEPLKISVLPTDMVHELRQWVSDLPTTFYVTCFALEFNGTKLNEFAQLSAVPELKSGCTLRVVKDVYNDRAVRVHVRRLRNLIDFTKPDTYFNPSPLSQENLSPALIPSLLRAATGSEIPDEFTKPHTTHLASIYTPILAAPSFECLNTLAFSAWNPPTAARAMYGDLAYLKVITLENRTLHITAHTQGFYVNRSTDTVFDPREHTSYSSTAHDLVTLLRAVSPKFTSQFTALCKYMTDQHPFELLASSNRVNQWIVPELPVRPNAGRAEDHAFATSECDASNPGIVRDWNSELQEMREMPADTLPQRLLRDRLIARFNAEFLAASLRGAQAIVQGNVPTLNPVEDSAMHMYLWNNIFFSYAVDARDIFKAQGGDQAAHAAAAADLRGVMAVMEASVDKLSVLATAVIDYAGRRLVAQAIVPGIVKRDNSQTIVHGALDPGTPVLVNDSFTELLSKVGEALHIRPHKIRNTDDTVVDIHGSAEFKGMKGSDDRLYVLDLYRTMPRDPNFVYTEGCKEVRHGVYTLRQELVTAYYEHSFVQAVRRHVAEKQQEAKSTKEDEQKDKASDVPAAAAAAAAAAPTTADGATAEAGAAEDAEKEGPERVEVDLNDIPKFKYNPDTLTPYAAADTEEEKEADMRALKELSNFLLEGVIPRFLMDMATGRLTLLDGVALTEAMHSRGINMRYLGFMLQRLDGPQAPNFAKKLLLMELLSRVAKHHLRAVLAEVPQEWTSGAIAHFLNCYLGNVVQPPEWAQFVAGRAHAFNTGSKKRQTKPAPPSGIADMTSASLWAAMQATAKLHFQFALPERKALVSYFTTTKLPLLRSLCRKTGVQLFAKDYSLGAPLPFTPADVAGLLPLAKTLAPSSSDGLAMHERAVMLLSKGNAQGYQMLDEAVSLFTQVHGSLHPSVAGCLRVLAQLHFQSDDVSSALELIERATIAMERFSGIDSAELVVYLTQLASICNSFSMPLRALVCLHHARQIIGLCFGEDHPEITRIDQSIATVLLTAGKSEAALTLFRTNTEAFEGRLTGGMELAISYELTARAAHESKDARAAVTYQRQALLEFERRLGPEDPRTKECLARLSAYTKDAVQAELYKKKNGPLSGTAMHTTSGRKGTRFTPDTRSVTELVDFINGAPTKGKAAKKKKAKKSASPTEQQP